MEISLDSDSHEPPSSPKNTGKCKERQQKRSRGLGEDCEIQAILKARAKPDGPTIDESNQVLGKMASIEIHDPLDSMASVIFL